MGATKETRIVSVTRYGEIVCRQLRDTGRSRLLLGKLSEGGDEKAQQCGWLKDKYGISWQIVPTELVKLLNDPDPEKSERVMKSILKMKKIDMETLKRAHEGQ